MCAVKRLFLVVVVATVVALCVNFSTGETLRYPVTDNFLHCLCTAISGCNTSVGCVGVICGPYEIIFEYWIDAGKPTLANDTGSDDAAYTRCVNDIVCSSKTVQQYMERRAPDCNGDGVINARDYFMAHYYGAYSCETGGEPTSQKYDTFKACMNAMNAREPQGDSDIRDQLVFST